MWPFPKKALTGTPEVLDGLRERGWAPFPLLGGGHRQRITDAFNTAQSANYAWIYQNSPAVRTVIDVLVRNVGQLDLRLYEEISEAERRPRPDHPAALSLRYPSEMVPGDRFIRQLLKDFLLFDNAYAYLAEAPGNQLTLINLPAHMMEIRGYSLFDADSYRYWRPDGTWQDFTPNQILHWRGESPLDPRLGMSKLETLRGVIAEDAALQQAIVELAQSGLTEPAWVFRPLDAPQWSNAAREGFEEDLNNRVRRRNKAPVVLEEGMEMRSFGVSPRDAQMQEVRRWATARIAAAYGVPLGMVGLDDNLEEAQRQFYGDTLPPLCEELAKMLNHRVLVRAYGWTAGCFEFNLDEKFMNAEGQLKALVSGTGRAVMLTNEARAKLNLPPVEGGDELVTPLNVLVGANPKPSPTGMGPQDPNGPDQGGGYREEPKALEGSRDGREVAGSAVTAPNGSLEAKAADRLPILHPTFRAEHERHLRHIDTVTGATAKHFGRLARSLQMKAETDWDRWDREFGRDLHRALKQVIAHEGDIYAFKLGGQFDTRRVENYVQATAESAAAGANGKVREEIAAEGLAAALARFDAHVESFGAGLGARASSFARLEAARQSPDPERREKRWVANTKRHAQWSGTTVPLGALWPAGFAPGTAPGCKCSISID